MSNIPVTKDSDGEFKAGVFEISDFSYNSDERIIRCLNCGMLHTLNSLMVRENIVDRDADEEGDIQGWHVRCPNCRELFLVIND